jgi:hypothetical protein
MTEDFDDVSFVRPFLGRALGGGVVPDTTDTHDSYDDAIDTRAFLITGGRTQLRSDVELGFETMLSTQDRAAAQRPFEAGALVALCLEQTRSVAELSALMKIPIGSALVLASELIASGVLQAHQGRSDLGSDVDMLRRLIQGVRGL